MEDKLSDVFETARLQQVEARKIQAITTRLVPSEQEVRQGSIDQAIRVGGSIEDIISRAALFTQFVLTGELPKEPTP